MSPAVGERVEECVDENGILELVEGRVSAARRAELEEHLDGCDSCRRLLAHAADALLDTADSQAPKAVSSDGLAAGDRVGRYRILRRVGAGAMGVVYAAEHEELKRRVALKVVRADDARGGDDRQLRGRLLREARAASAIRHPNVVTVHDVLELDDGSPVMVMDLLDGESLRARLESGPLPLDETIAIMSAVLSALEAAHAEGVIHRDLKPDNVFLCARRGGGYEVKLLDFGIAKLTALDGPAAESVGLTESGMLVGTPQYMAPEQAFGEAIDERVDLWAVGAMLYECISGRRPLEGDNLGQLLKKLARLSIPFLDTVVEAAPIDLVRLVHELLSERSARPRSASAVAARLAAIDVHEQPRVVVAPTPSGSGALDSEGATFAMAGDPSGSLSWARVRRSPWPWALMVGAAAALIVTAVSLSEGEPVAESAAASQPAAPLPIATLAPTVRPSAPSVADSAAVPSASASAMAAATPALPTAARRRAPSAAPKPSASAEPEAPGKLITTPLF